MSTLKKSDQIDSIVSKLKDRRIDFLELNAEEFVKPNKRKREKDEGGIESRRKSKETKSHQSGLKKKLGSDSRSNAFCPDLVVENYNISSKNRKLKKIEFCDKHKVQSFPFKVLEGNERNPDKLMKAISDLSSDIEETKSTVNEINDIGILGISKKSRHNRVSLSSTRDKMTKTERSNADKHEKARQLAAEIDEIPSKETKNKLTSYIQSILPKSMAGEASSSKHHPREKATLIEQVSGVETHKKKRVSASKSNTSRKEDVKRVDLRLKYMEWLNKERKFFNLNEQGLNVPDETEELTNIPDKDVEEEPIEVVNREEEISERSETTSEDNNKSAQLGAVLLEIYETLGKDCKDALMNFNSVYGKNILEFDSDDTTTHIKKETLKTSKSDSCIEYVKLFTDICTSKSSVVLMQSTDCNADNNVEKNHIHSESFIVRSQENAIEDYLNSSSQVGEFRIKDAHSIDIKSGESLSIAIQQKKKDGSTESLNIQIYQGGSQGHYTVPQQDQIKEVNTKSNSSPASNQICMCSNESKKFIYHNSNTHSDNNNFSYLRTDTRQSYSMPESQSGASLNAPRVVSQPPCVWPNYCNTTTQAFLTAKSPSNNIVMAPYIKTSNNKSLLRPQRERPSVHKFNKNESNLFKMPQRSQVEKCQSTSMDAGKTDVDRNVAKKNIIKEIRQWEEQMVCNVRNKKELDLPATAGKKCKVEETKNQTLEENKPTGDPLTLDSKGVKKNEENIPWALVSSKENIPKDCPELEKLNKTNNKPVNPNEESMEGKSPEETRKSNIAIQCDFGSCTCTNFSISSRKRKYMSVENCDLLQTLSYNVLHRRASLMRSVNRYRRRMPKVPSKDQVTLVAIMKDLHSKVDELQEQVYHLNRTCSKSASIETSLQKLKLHVTDSLSNVERKLKSIEPNVKHKGGNGTHRKNSPAELSLLQPENKECITDSFATDNTITIEHSNNNSERNIPDKLPEPQSPEMSDFDIEIKTSGTSDTVTTNNTYEISDSVKVNKNSETSLNKTCEPSEIQGTAPSKCEINFSVDLSTETCNTAKVEQPETSIVTPTSNSVTSDTYEVAKTSKIESMNSLDKNDTIKNVKTKVNKTTCTIQSQMSHCFNTTKINPSVNKTLEKHNINKSNTNKESQGSLTENIEGNDNMKSIMTQTSESSFIFQDLEYSMIQENDIEGIDNAMIEDDQLKDIVETESCCTNCSKIVKTCDMGVQCDLYKNNKLENETNTVTEKDVKIVYRSSTRDENIGTVESQDEEMKNNKTRKNKRKLFRNFKEFKASKTQNVSCCVF